MIFEQISVGGDRNYSYLVAAAKGGEAFVVDPAFMVNRVVQRIRDYELKLKYIINTHGHFDHVGGNSKLKGECGGQIVMHSSSAGDIGVDDGDELQVDDLKFRFIYTPGHTSDSMCVLVEDCLITGDTLFVGKVGGTGFGEDARNEYDSLHQKLMVLPDEIKVYPGHNYGTAETSTIGQERETNPFIKMGSFDEFVDLKMNWLEYKKKHGIK